MTKIQKMIVEYMNNNNFGNDWSRTPNEQGEFFCWGTGNHIDAIFRHEETKKDGTVMGVIHPGGGAFKIGNIET